MDTRRVGVPASYPEQLRSVLEDLSAALLGQESLLRALVVYGSLARGNFRQGESDVNLAVVLEHASPTALTKLSAPLRVARRAARVEPWLLTAAEIPRLADVFPTKLLDIKRHHDLLYGVDPFSGVELARSNVRFRVEQELRNHLLRLRRTWTFAAGEVRVLASALYASAGSLGVELEALLWLLGVEPPGPDPEQIFEVAARELDLDGGVLLMLAEFKRGTGKPDAGALFLGLVEVIERAVEAAYRLEPTL